jgi:hypothetical protein
VTFVLVSHLDRTRSLSYRVAVDPAVDGAPTRREAGNIRIVPGETREVQSRLASPSEGGYTVSVSLPELDQPLRARCPGRRP